jgi:hypothetical protein
MTWESVEEFLYDTIEIQFRVRSIESKQKKQSDCPEAKI